MDQRTAHPHRLFRLWTVGLLLSLSALLLTGCGGGRAVVAPVEELSDRSHARPAPVVRATTHHRVQPGDTLHAIAFLYGLDYRQLVRWNGLRSANLIRVGQRLRLTPPPQSAKASKPKPKPKPAKPAASAKKPAASKPKRVARAEPKPKPKAQPKKQTKPAAKPAPKPYRGPAKLSWRWPAEGKLLTTFSKRKPGRKGIDIGGKRGRPVVAASGGEVVYSGSGLQRYYGKLIIIKHNDRFLSAYAHNDKLLVKEGARVKSGQRIATLGSSGTDRVKLHFEIRRDGKPVNPMRYLPKKR